MNQHTPEVVKPPFMTVKLGTYESSTALRQALLDAGNKISDWGGDILARIEVVSEPMEVGIVVVSVAELGFPNGATRTRIYDKALSTGLRLCPAEVGPQFRLQYTNQPNDEWIFVAMEPISDSAGDHGVFDVGHVSSGWWLCGFCGRPSGFCSGCRRWAFLYK